MERVKRRWWTWAVSLIAIAVIAGAALSGAFQLAVLAVPSYRADLAAWVSQVTGRPVQIGGISLAWRGLAPRFDLNGITLFSADGSEQLRLDRLSLGVSLRRLLIGDWVPSRLELSGLRISAEIDEQGRIRIAGFDAGDEGLPSTRHEHWLQDLERFEHVVLENCELRMQHAAFEGVPLSLRLERVTLARNGRGFELDADLLLPAERGGELHLEADIAGAVSDPRQWNGSFEATADALQPQGWLRPWLRPGTQIAAADLGGRLSGEIAGGQVTRTRLELASGALVLARAGVLSSAQQSSIVLDYLRNPRGWRLDVTDLSFDQSVLLRGSLRYDLLDGEGAYDFDADTLEMTRLAPWFGVWRETPRWLHTAGRATGTVEGLVLRYREAPSGPRFSARARLHGVGLRADRSLGFAGVSGELSADEAGGRLQLNNATPTLELPAALEQPLKFDALNAELRWSRGTDGWRVASEGFGWRLASLEGHGRFALQLPSEAGASPLLDLDATFSAQDANDARPYMARHWSTDLKTWLTRGIVQARVPRGELRIRGPVQDFPFHSRPTGEWRLDLDVADAVLDYAPGWPRLSDIRAHLRFRGNALEITAEGAQLGGNRVQSAVVRFEDFSDHTLSVDGVVEGELARYYQFLRASPLRRTLRGLLDNTQARGEARVDIKLRIPVDHAEQASVAGRVAIADAQLRYGELDPITGLRGTLAFTDRGVSADSLQGRFLDLPLQLRIEPQIGTLGVIRGSFPFAPQASGRGASQFIPGFLRGALQGASNWLLELPLRDTDTALVLTSDLVGTTVALPAPLGKPAEESAPVWLRIGSDAQAPVRIDAGYDARIAFNVAVGRQNAGWQATGVHARLGALEAPPARAGSFLLDGRVDRLEPAAWFAALDRLASPPGAAAGDAGLNINAADIEVKHLVWGDERLRPTRLQYRPTADGWQLDLTGEGAEGRLSWWPGGGGRLSARLAHLRLDVVPPPPAAMAGETPAPPSEPPADPSRFPVLDLLCDQLGVGDVVLGRVELASERVPGGLALRRLRISGGITDLDLAGAWRRIGGKSSAELRFDLASGDVSKLLAALGYAPSLDADRSHFSGELGWAPAAEGLRWELADGRIDVEVEQGQLRAVQPGASRVLGLINFYALPRRLTLDFADVVGEGLAFDRIKGRFDLAAGDATTGDLHIDGPSLRMDIRGRVGLVARDYDQRVTVYPDVSAGVTLGAVLLGGPAVGALVLLAQELLDKPLDQVTQFSYRISGPWDNPRVERLDAAARPG